MGGRDAMVDFRWLILAISLVIPIFPKPSIAALPFEIQLSDLVAPVGIDGADIKAAMGLCGESYFGGGCTIVLPRQVISMTTTLQFGADGVGGGNYVNGITIRGQGSCSPAFSPVGISTGSTLRWDGPNNGTMIEIKRAQRLRFENLCLQLDPDMTGGGNAALYGVLFNGDNVAGNISQGVVFEAVGFWGVVSGTPTIGSAAVYITGAGLPKSAENDKMHFIDCYTRGTDVGVKQDALQALVNVWQGGELRGYTNALYVSGGNFDVRDALVSCDNPTSCVVLNLDYQASAGNQETLFSNVYWETLTTGTFLRVGQGWSGGNSTFGPNHPIVVENSYALNGRTGSPGACQNTLLDAATQSMIVFRNNHLNANDIDCGFNIKVSNPVSQPLGFVYWDDNSVNNFTASGFLVPTITGANVKLKAISINSTGTLYNDVNLNRIKDASEPAL